MEKLPEKIFPIDYAGFFDFNEDGKYGESVINVMDYRNAEQIANEIAKRYNNHEQLLKALKSSKTALEELFLERYENYINKEMPYPVYIRKQPILQEINELLKHLESNPLKN